MVRARLLACVVAAGCGGGGGFPDAAVDSPPPGPGSFSLAWTVTDANSQPLVCSKIGASAVTATLRNLKAVGGMTEVFTCASGMGTSQRDIQPGTYEIAFELDASSGVLQTAPTQHAVVIASNQVTTLAPISFAVNATGGMKLHIAANGAATNCGAAPTGGAIDGMTISMQHGSAGTCEPVMFAIAAGATKPAGTYMIDCTTPANTGCIENDQEVTAVGVPSDQYTFHIHGNVAAATCWSNNDQVTVPPLAATVTKTLNLGHAVAGTPGC